MRDEGERAQVDALVDALVARLALASRAWVAARTREVLGTYCNPPPPYTTMESPWRV